MLGKVKGNKFFGRMSAALLVSLTVKPASGSLVRKPSDPAGFSQCIWASRASNGPCPGILSGVLRGPPSSNAICS